MALLQSSALELAIIVKLGKLGRIFSLFQLEAANAMRYHARVPIKIPMVIALRNTQTQWSVKRYIQLESASLSLLYILVLCASPHRGLAHETNI